MPTTRILIGPEDTGRKMTMEEFREADETPGYLYELARGVLEVSEVPADAHGQIIHNLHVRLILYYLQHQDLILRLAHGSDIQLLIFETESDRHPDLAIVFRGAPLNPRGRQIPGLVVEVVSPGARARRRDYEEKREEYLRLGIAEYWIVDPESRHVTVLVRQDAGANSSWAERVFQGDDSLESTLLPGFEGPVGALWVDVDPEREGP